MSGEIETGATGAARAGVASPQADALETRAEPLDADRLRAELSRGASHSPSPGRWWRDARRRRLLALADFVAGAIAFMVVVPPHEAIWLAAFLPIWVLVAKLVGLYDRDHRVLRHLTVDEVPAIAAWAAISVIVVGLLAELTPAGALEADQIGIAALVAVACGFVFRVLARGAWRASTPRERVLVVGSGALAAAMRRKLELFGDLHMRPVELRKRAEHVDRVLLAHERVDAGQIARITDVCRRYEAKLSLISPLRGQATPQSISRIAELPVLEYGTSDVSRSTMLLKRVLDVAVAVPLMVLLAPLLPVIALAIKLDSRGPVLFAQVRAGLGGRPFRLYKFRTMQVGAESSLPDLVRLEDLREPMFKLRRDPRVTRVGRVLRRLSLDELPQVWNLLRGDMSLVGPRPEQLDLVERYRPEHRFRLSVKPGLTGPMQVYGRGELTFPERLAVELDYVENLSLGRDLRILALTPLSVVRGTGAF